MDGQIEATSASAELCLNVKFRASHRLFYDFAYKLIGSM